ncbi:cytochrome d ubiquinol oxidase subunit II [Acidiphilium sp.]|uniref:cytochrome d ubiquinol oxidase subunit II n=1 Tax=Acidiphilium sp. TaxID=527 RepID=UPI00258C86FC|nr:cytochrome d ubiquinol oxidase subunit II [Acidiphilium sp.]
MDAKTTPQGVTIAREFTVLTSALYIPLFLMLAGLIWRGVAFEFRFKADASHQAFWDKAFAWGSYVATFCQGAAVGAFINGFKVEGPSYQGGAFDWLTPFSVFTGLGLMVAYALLGCTWLVMKTDGALEARMRAAARWRRRPTLGPDGNRRCAGSRFWSGPRSSSGGSRASSVSAADF